MIINNEYTQRINDDTAPHYHRCRIYPNDHNDDMWCAIIFGSTEVAKVDLTDARHIYDALARLFCAIESETGVRL